VREALEAVDREWPEDALVAEAVTAGELDEVVGEAELMFADAKVVLLLDDVDDQVAARPYLEAEGWRICTSVKELGVTLNELESGA
jgi:DEAD/DEAH box helicase domain-containing protein